MKIPFDIKYRDKIESGEYKVETKEGIPVRIVCWDAKGPQPILGLVYNPDALYDTAEFFCENGKYWRFSGSDSPNDLFLVTPEPEMSEFEKAVSKYRPQSDTLETIQGIAAELLSFARNEFNKQIENDYWEIIYGAYERGKAEAEQEVERRLQSGELLTQEHHEKLMETLREECKKDLPRWRNVEADKRYVGCVTRYMDVNGDWNYCMSSGKLSDDCQYISIAALEKLPKEDEK